MRVQASLAHHERVGASSGCLVFSKFARPHESQGRISRNVLAVLLSDRKIFENDSPRKSLHPDTPRLSVGNDVICEHIESVSHITNSIINNKKEKTRKR